MTKGTAIRNLSAILGAILLAYMVSSAPVCAWFDATGDVQGWKAAVTFCRPFFQVLKLSKSCSNVFETYCYDGCVSLYYKCGVKPPRMQYP